MKDEGRNICYIVANEKGEVYDRSEGLTFTFKGDGVEELKEKLKEETGLNDIVVCTRSPLNGKLFPLRLRLPPNNADMNVVVVPSSKGLLFGRVSFLFFYFCAYLKKDILFCCFFFFLSYLDFVEKVKRKTNYIFLPLYYIVPRDKIGSNKFLKHGLSICGHGQTIFLCLVH